MKPEKKKRGRPPSGEPHKEFIGIRLRPDLRDELLNAAYWSRLSFNALIEEGALLMLKRLRKEHNGSPAVPFPPRPQD
jgi:hypothetical protein